MGVAANRHTRFDRLPAARCKLTATRATMPCPSPAATLDRLSWRTAGAYARRNLNEVYDVDGSPIAAEGLKCIARLYDIEEAIRGQSAGQCKPTRQTQTKPLMVDFEIWLKTQRSHISAKSRHGEKLGYIAKYMEGLKLLLDEGSVEMDGYSSVSLLKILYGRLGRPR